VNSFGGFVKQYQVLVDPDKLINYNLTFRQVFEALERNNANAGGNYIEHLSEQYVVRGVGLVKTIDDIKNIVIDTHEGTAHYIRDVADVVIGPEVRQGAVTMNGEGETVAGIALMLRGASGRDVVARVKDKVQDIKSALPPGVTMKPFYDRTELVTKAIATVTKALEEGAVFVVIVLLLLLGNVRSALIVTLVLPIAALVAFIMMNQVNLSANLMSLGGLAIGIGMMVDGAVVMVENIYRLRSEKPAEPIASVVLEAGKEVGRPIVFGISIIIVVFLPLFTLQGFEGKMFAPMAYTISFALLGSLILSLTFVPVMCTYLLKGRISEKDNILLSLIKKLYLPVLNVSLKYRAIVIASAVALLIFSLVLFPFIGTEFLPQLDEGAIAVKAIRSPSISLTQSLEMNGHIESILKSFPEVTAVVSKTGRAEIASDPEGPEVSDILVSLKPREEWMTTSSKEELVDLMRKKLSVIPGVVFGFTQPIQMRVDELVSGVRSQIAVKLFGEDMTVLKTKADEINGVMSKVRGVADLKVEQVTGLGYFQIEIDRHKLSRYGINVADVQEIVEAAIGGKVATKVFEGQRHFAVVLRLPEQKRTVDAVGNIFVSTPDGARVPLSQLASIRIEEGPAQISRENASRRIVVECNVVGRDIGGFVADAQSKIAASVKLPTGYYITWGGQFENQQRAMARLYVVVPLVILLIFVLLFSSFNSLRNASLIILNIPFSMIGGIVALYLSGFNLSVSASVGFIALFGVAVLNGIVMVSYFNKLRLEGMELNDAIRKGAELRLRPVLMTALVAALGLLPMVFASGIGAEIQKPLAIVVIGGLMSSTLLTLIVLPALYGWFEKEQVEF
jgi:cobalt-zinc-cadmium resistance protein CzcA